MGHLAEGPRLQALVELRQILADRLLDAATPATAMPGLSKQLRDVLLEMERLAPVKGSPVDELAGRRRNRRAGVPADATGS